MYEAQTEQAIKQRMLDRILSTIDKSEGSLTYDAISPVSVEVAQEYVELDRILALVFAQTSSGEYLEKRAGEFGVLRNQGVNSTGTIRISGTNGTVIPSGTRVQTPGGLAYITLAGATISGGIADINVEAEAIGTLYNVPGGSVTQLPVQIIGVTGVTNQDTMSGGTDIETDEGLLLRLLAKVQTPSTSGNANDYRVWSLAVSGVGDAKVFPIWNGNGTVKVVVLDVNKQPADNSLVTAVSSAIETSRPIGATVTVVAAQGVNINFTVTVVKDAAYTLQQVTNNITNKITDYLKSIAFKSTYASYAQIGNAIIDSEGVLDYSNLLVNGGTANIAIGAEQVAVLGTVGVS